ncbi:hypothetical protein E2C01_048191 [Portunus trituberculatus]|uniref:Uncharacterized protein n=1 Tax=Portunus trituberculatus TaxID=210409 RepID=A0A5B7G2H8_PORTR|nr:hypothetical protein [Portunus trituberculatus]
MSRDGVTRRRGMEVDEHNVFTFLPALLCPGALPSNVIPCPAYLSLAFASLHFMSSSGTPGQRAIPTKINRNKQHEH